MLDVTLLAKDITTLLVPAIPFLLKGGEKAFEEAWQNPLGRSLLLCLNRLMK
jgi:hypothetical protein